MGFKRRLTGVSVIAATLTVTAGGLSSPAHADATATSEYTVVAADNVSNADATAAIKSLGGTVIRSNEAVGMFTVKAPATGFVEKAAASPALTGAAHEISIGRAYQKTQNVETEGSDSKGSGSRRHGGPGLDPLDDWGKKMVRTDQARKIEPGDKRVTVGVLDTGVDASNPDIGQNFNWQLSRNFAPDKTDIDGPCEVASCLDPVGTDDGGHGTHVAGIIGAAANGMGVSGVAPNVSLVELKGGQDSGFFFLEPVVNALVYAGQHGVDVVNMSFFVDPWLYNCTANPADSPTAQAEQRTIIKGMFRALTFAHFKGTTLLGALGNEHDNKNAPRTDTTSPDYPVGTAYPRPVDTELLLRPAGRRPVRDRRLGGRPVGWQVRLLELRHQVHQRGGAGRLVPRRLRHADVPNERQRDPLQLPEVGASGGRPGRRGRQRHAGQRGLGVEGLQERQVRVLHVPAGHLDGLAARRGRGRAHRQQVRAQ